MQRRVDYVFVSNNLQESVKTQIYLLSSIYIEGTNAKSTFNFFNCLCLNKITLRHKLKNFDIFKSRFDRCLKFA